MAYKHGVYMNEESTSLKPPVTVDSAVQFIVGTAPINLLEDPIKAVNQLILINSFKEAEEKIGYSNSFDKFSICESIDASFKIYNVSPLVVINVLDPQKHNIAVTGENYNLVNNKFTIKEEGIMLDDSFIVKSSAGSPYIKDADYTVEFDDNGYVLLKIVKDGQIDTNGENSIQVDYTQLDPSAVTDEDIIGGYNNSNGKYNGLENISQVYPKLGITTGLIIIPGWSHKSNISAAMTSKTESLNGSFKCEALKDVDCSKETGALTYSDVKIWKNNNLYNDKHDIVLWPMIKIGNKKYHYSAIMGPLIAYTDNNNDGIPYVSPSNKKLKISGTILEDGTEVYLDQVQANYLNGQGVVTAININGWTAWGNRTGIYPSSTDPKDTFIPVRRMFDWWGNTFIQTYLEKIDNPMNRRLIETIVDSENIRANGFKARQQIAGAKIEYLEQENSATDLIDGIIKFHQYLTPYPPAREIIDILEYSPDALNEALGGE